MLRWTYYYSSTVLSGNIWQELELESEPPKLWTKVAPEPKINNFGSATLKQFMLAGLHNQLQVLFLFLA